MAKYASKVVDQAKAWLGKKEKDGSFKVIIDTYNSYKPLPRGYAVKYTDEWCATFVSATAIKLGYTSIIPPECSCPKMIDLFKNIGAWVENENRTPKVGDIIFYDWEDNGTGDNKGAANHVGIVEKVSNGVITVIEGNKNEAVERREIKVNGKYIRGYGVPKYDAEPKATTTKKSTIKKGDKVKVNKGAKSYNGKVISSFIYNNTYTVDELKGDRAVLDAKGICTAFNVKDLTIVKSTATPTPKPTIKVGSTVKINKGAKTYTGGGLASFVYNRKLKVKQISGNRVVVTYLGIVIAAVNIKDLTLA